MLVSEHVFLSLCSGMVSFTGTSMSPYCGASAVASKSRFMEQSFPTSVFLCESSGDTPLRQMTPPTSCATASTVLPHPQPAAQQQQHLQQFTHHALSADSYRHSQYSPNNSYHSSNNNNNHVQYVGVASPACSSPGMSMDHAASVEVLACNTVTELSTLPPYEDADVAGTFTAAQDMFGAGGATAVSMGNDILSQSMCIALGDSSATAAYYNVEEFEFQEGSFCADSSNGWSNRYDDNCENG